MPSQPGPSGGCAGQYLGIAAADLEVTSTALLGDDSIDFVAARTGATNLMASVACCNSAGLPLRHVSQPPAVREHDLGAITPLRHLAISPVLRRVKQVGSMV